MNKLLAIAALCTLAGCQAHHSDALATAEPARDPVAKPVSAPPVAVFSTYLSDTASERCAAIHTGNSCEEDAIRPEAFLKVLEQDNYFPNAVASSTQLDYEILIANQAARVSTANWWQQTLHYVTAGNTTMPAEFHMFTEVTVQWRGVEIDSRLIVTVAGEDFRTSQQQQARRILQQWLSQTEQEQIFAASYLYQSMQASDYLNKMELPDTIDEFQQLDTQLYPDPFKGVISRYVHPQFENALLDISVYPITAPLEKGTERLLTESLQQEQQEAQLVAEARGLALQVDKPIQKAALQSDYDGEEDGYVLAMSASSAQSDTLYSSTYVFRQHDKIIKLSATFPTRVADNLIAQALPRIKVPAESPLMAGLRQLQQQQHQGQLN